jgi:hypothetical protein
MEGLLAVCPYMNGPFNSGAKGFAKAAAIEALKNLSKLANEPYMTYLMLTASSSGTSTAWLQDLHASNRWSKRTNYKQQATTLRPLAEAAVVVLHLISIAFRPEFKASLGPGPGQHQRKRWTRTVPCKNHIVPYLEADHNGEAPGLIEPYAVCSG